MTDVLQNPAHQVARCVLQQAIMELAKWAEASLPEGWKPQESSNNNAIDEAKSLLDWGKDAEIGHLEVLFDRISLKKDSTNNRENHYWHPRAIADEKPKVPYPQNEKPADPNFEQLKEEIRGAFKNLKPENLDKLPLLGLLIEKFGSFVSFAQSDVALVDMARSTAAVASALAKNPTAENLRLVAGDLSGIQNFIYTISSDGALKSLRARSFYLELITEEVVQRLLEALELPRTSIIYAGGGNLYLLAPDTQSVKEKVKQVRDALNQDLLKQFQSKVFLALDSHEFQTTDIQSQKFAESWSNAVKGLAKQKSKKFDSLLEEVLSVQDTYEPCKVCHRDDDPNLKPLKEDEPGASLACGTCRRMFRLGGQLLRVKAIVRSKRDEIPLSSSLSFSEEKEEVKFLKFQDIKYYLLKDKPGNLHLEDDEICFLINNWSISSYTYNLTIPLFLGNYSQKSNPSESGAQDNAKQEVIKKEITTTISAHEMVDQAHGIPRVGYLRMDVDKLGQIFAKGLGDRQNLARIAGLSRQMTYYFKVYLNNLAEHRQENLPKTCKQLTDDVRQNLLFIYAGGDDLFISGTWNEIIEFAFDVYQSFRCYTGNNPDISLSGGVAMTAAKFPLYQAADLSGEAEDKAKANGRDSFGAFGCVFKWSEWLGTISEDKIGEREYLQPETMPELIGVLPFVRALHNPENSESIPDYLRSFIRNLLLTAKLQDKAIEDAKDKSDEFKKDLRYFLHLPRVAYTLARLPARVRDAEGFRPVRTSLKSPYNAPYFRAIATWLEYLNRKSNRKKE
ncbi:MAG: type III-A CRISPR-associated protein Cas10/Csm1 [Cyanobacteria bacterium SID2]|nr:type III-A CRISPR-associated protein Cas10/Csm1 [Cyanobacteria bacterium SID2]